MQDKPLVSILMNCFNGEKYLREAINSVYFQTYKNWEVIFVDNCSTDNSANIAKSYNDGKLKYYKTKKNLPLGAARNWGIKFIKGDFLAFLDTDDIWLNNKLEKQLNIINKNIAFVYSPVIQINEFGQKLRRTKINKKSDFKSLLERYDINMHSTLINLKLVDVSFNENLSYCPDYEFFMKIVSRGNKYSFTSVSLVKYRLHPNSLSNKSMDIQLEEIISVLDTLKNDTFLYNKYKKSFDICLFKFDHLLKAKKMLISKSFYSSSKEFFLLSKFSKKYLLASILLIVPILNKYFYNKILYKYF